MFITQMQTPFAFHNDSVCKCISAHRPMIRKWFLLKLCVCICNLNFEKKISYAFESCKLVLFTAVSPRKARVADIKGYQNTCTVAEWLMKLSQY